MTLRVNRCLFDEFKPRAGTLHVTATGGEKRVSVPTCISNLGANCSPEICTSSVRDGDGGFAAMQSGAIEVLSRLGLADRQVGQ